MHVACEFLVRECTRGVATTRHICPTSYTARNNEPVIGILGRVCISIQDVVASPIDVTTFQSNSPFASFHDLHFPSALAFPPRQFLPTRRVLCTHVIYKKEKLAPSVTKERMRKFVKSFDRRDQHLRVLRLLLPFQKERIESETKAIDPIILTAQSGFTRNYRAECTSDPFHFLHLSNTRPILRPILLA